LTDRIRLALLIFVVMTATTARVGGALGATRVADRPAAHAVSHATAVAREQARITKFARKFIGVRYQWGGISPSSGFDCSGFTRYVYAHFGITLPHYTGSQFTMGRRVSRWGLRPGDLVFFHSLGHVGLYIGSGRFIHAPHSGTTVSIDSMSGHYGGGFDGARRLLR
jgi:cell wall-associated NlpC family hydrolase